MTATEPLHDPAALAAHARSILSLPRSVSLVIEGAEHQLDEGVSLREDDGVPTLFAPLGSTVDLAAGAHRSVLLRLTGDLGPANSRGSSLVIAGTLRQQGECAHGDAVRVVTLDIGLVSLVIHGPDDVERHITVPMGHFRSPEHRLNRGYLIGCQRHANDCHQGELLQAVALATDTDLHELAAVSIKALEPTGLVLRWIDLTGAHERTITFPRPARHPEELAGLLSSHLHAGLH